MAITNKGDLKPGVVLVAKYKGETYHADVVVVEGGTGTIIRLRESARRVFDTVSGAGKAIRGGKETNGWAFWSIEGAADTPPNGAHARPIPKPTRKARTRKKAAPAARETMRCDGCGAMFETAEQASEHFLDEHPA